MDDRREEGRRRAEAVPEPAYTADRTVKVHFSGLNAADELTAKALNLQFTSHTESPYRASTTASRCLLEASTFYISALSKTT